MLTIAEASQWMALSEEEFARRLSSLQVAGGDSVSAGSDGNGADELVLPGLKSGRGRCVAHELMRKLTPSPKNAVMTVGIQKGGVGKTVISLNLAVALSMAGIRVLFVDCDPQASATNFLLPEDQQYDHLPTLLEVCCEEPVDFCVAATATRYAGLDLIASKPAVRKVDAHLRKLNALEFLREKMNGTTERYDCVLFDVPPGFGDLVRSAYLLSSTVLMPVLPDVWSLESASLTKADIEEAAEETGSVSPRIFLFLNRFRSGRIASAEVLEVLQENSFGQILDISLPETAQIQNSVNNGMSVLEGSVPAARQVFLDLSSRLWHQGG